MAIDFKKHLAQLKAKDVEPLNETELNLVKEKENFIDKEIEGRYSTNHNELNIDYDKVKFDYPNMTYARAEFLEQELIKRYKDAGWEVQIVPPSGGYHDEVTWFKLTGKKD